MINITPFSSKVIKLDAYLDYVPFVSSATNLAKLFFHVVEPYTRSFLKESKINSNHYFNYLHTSDVKRSVILLVPFIGNVYIAMSDYQSALIVDSLEEIASQMDKTTEDLNLVLLEAACHGSLKSLYRLGLRYLVANKIEDGRLYIRFAAAKGHIGAGEFLQKIEQNKQS